MPDLSRSGLRDAVTTGLCRIEGHRAVLIVFDFDFLGGTMGSVAGEKIALKLGIIDVVVPEPEGGAHLNPDAAANELKSHLLAALREVRTVSPRRLLAIRYERYRHIGRVGVHWRGLVRSAIGNAFGVVAGLLRGTALRQGSTQALNPMKPVRTGDS